MLAGADETPHQVTRQSSRHRNLSVPGHYTGDVAITDIAVHDFDVVRWLLDEDFVAATVLTPRRSRHGGELPDPILTRAGGQPLKAL